MILYHIWKRVTEENQILAEQSQSEIQTEYLKESQFYMACKLVALYQQKMDEIMSSTQSMTMVAGDDDILPPQVVNEHISKASKILAKFNLDNFGKDVKKEEEEKVPEDK